ncbi:hypothetical protein AAFF_G00334540 [Aldrovandia affinis]|uniref:CUE domain-containing protein n=1 Tax=Aldrovandia affinis TaxID=143900 RepID=A0AAD7WPG6_9TELE|nr:hypothetical protein AAFF_G00334540 [Aldrovandia affinis]
MNPHGKPVPDEINNSNKFANRPANNLYRNQERPDDGDNTNSPSNQNTQPEQNDRQAQYVGGYMVIPPNESRRSKLLRMAQQEEQDLQRWREENQPGPITLPPSHLGGTISLAEARQKQFVQLRQSKVQKKLQQEAMERSRRAEEEEENQRMKDAQREKAQKLEERRKQEDQQRQEQYEQDRQATMQHFLQRVENSSSAPTATSSSLPASSWARVREYRETERAAEHTHLEQRKEEQRRKGELQEEKQKKLEEEKEREIFMEHRRVNAAFLDRLQGGTNAVRGEEPAGATPEEDCDWRVPEPHVPSTSPLTTGPGLASVQADSAEEDDDDDDSEWAVMKLINNFPFYERDFLEDIVNQCNGNYQKAYDLLQ